MEFKTLIKERRSCRVYETSPVTEEQLTAILEAGQWAPNPLNLQPWEFIVIRDGEIKTKIRKASEDARQLVMDNGAPNGRPSTARVFWKKPLSWWWSCTILQRAVWEIFSDRQKAPYRPLRPVFRTCSLLPLTRDWEPYGSLGLNRKSFIPF